MNIEEAVNAALLITGWMSTRELQWLAIQASTRDLIIELGSWKGRSTKALAACTHGKVYAVDNWLAKPPSEALREYHEWKEVQERGSDAVHADFLANLSEEIRLGKLEDVMAESEAGFGILASKLGVRQADMVFIDADHDYEMVRRDIRLWTAMVKPGGLLCGHDYSRQWPSVRKAVDEEVPSHGVVAGTSIWMAVA